MRKNTERVAKAFDAGKTDNKDRAIHTDGESIFSYKTVLLKKGPKGLLLNAKKYSVTTSKQQTDLRAFFGDRIVGEF